MLYYFNKSKIRPAELTMHKEITIKKNPESDQEKRYRSGSLLRGIAFSIIEIKNSENL